MGMGTLGFVSGAAHSAKDRFDTRIEAREKAERDRENSVFLEQLRRETDKYMLDLKMEAESTLPDKDQSQIDYERGVRVNRNMRGEVVGEVPLTESEKSDYSLDRRGAEADISYKESRAKYAPLEAMANIDQSRASAERSRRPDSVSGSGKSLDATDSLEAGVMKALQAKYGYAIKKVVDDKAATDVEVQNVLADIAANAKNGAEAEADMQAWLAARGQANSSVTTTIDNKKVKQPIFR